MFSSSITAASCAIGLITLGLDVMLVGHSVMWLMMCFSSWIYGRRVSTQSNGLRKRLLFRDRLLLHRDMRLRGLVTGTEVGVVLVVGLASR
jgi:hypothetical protein